MPTLKEGVASSLNIEVDKEGFLMKTEMWTREVAQALAHEEMQSDLTPDHWKVVDCVRNYFHEFGVAPAEQIVCKTTGFDVHYIEDLFPTGYAQGACKVAGLPKPDPHMFGRLTNYAGTPAPE